ncbi:Hypothetical Protein RradSPS_0928 [Rubrobacter radiotolerans]|uniref:Glycosyltransferase n=1 Tax=Rubrobacter radiotolerans TaxID=42256 RepID=A0A023X1X8_RUBRA|nr:glycosyltransferase [Rubrobacter radiotolerans]AHY46211.1 Hypothetical Protein RradSPS_0928 [Rubrobacter radiotolerans]MDX5893620.1 glycosyltransferase [Rubrobacter radiotolerans]SMC04137.1 Glycosyltransferase involved in cell wall bisynthesis [Rubrobacter radiotolerans DSM 5868]
MSEPPRVLSYPPVHDYVDRLHEESARLVHRDEGWPRLERFYNPDWLAANASGWDLAHLHFTWEQHGPERLRAVLDAHERAGKPVVWTAHDLRNPHTPRAGEDEAYLKLLARRADAVVTLTAGAAAEVCSRYGRSALVIGHGPLLDSSSAGRLRGLRERRVSERKGPARVLLLAKSFRRNLDWRTPLRVASDLEGRVVLDVVAHRRAPEVGELLETVRGTENVSVELRRGPLDFGELCRRLALADALLLPYLWGTHSGLLELSTDLGTPVVAASVGYLAEQAPVLSVPGRGERLDAAALREALLAVSRGETPPSVPLAARREALSSLRDAHRRLYKQLLPTLRAL